MEKDLGEQLYDINKGIERRIKERRANPSPGRRGRIQDNLPSINYKDVINKVIEEYKAD